jgi:hypothetical protein
MVSKVSGTVYSLPNRGPNQGVCPADRGTHEGPDSLPYFVPFNDGLSIQTRRWLYPHLGRGDIKDFVWDEVKHDSFVVMSAAEARNSANPPDRFIGDAWKMSVYNIAPHDGGIWFNVFWEARGQHEEFPFLDVWVDVILINA